ncbi:MAG: bifunctional hydroxymethylpyrimidine kinase/phosphomethylpyrimidine kinase [Thermodesulfobacteriota bacterium]
MKKILTIAGSDSGGGAGIQTDLKTIALLGGYGTSVLTALTAQNTLGVQGVHPVPETFIRQQMDSVLTDIGTESLKIGMLATAGIVRTVGEGLRALTTAPVVLDPVMVATSGDILLAEDARQCLQDELFPLATVVTPNLGEAELLCGFPVADRADMEKAAAAIHAQGPHYVLIKGGHLIDEAADLLFDGREHTWFHGRRINTPHTHGTGCTYSAAIAAFLAQTQDMHQAVHQAKQFITQAIAAAEPLGHGRGPTNPYAAIFGAEDNRAST